MSINEGCQCRACSSGKCRRCKAGAIHGPELHSSLAFAGVGTAQRYVVGAGRGAGAEVTGTMGWCDRVGRPCQLCNMHCHVAPGALVASLLLSLPALFKVACKVAREHITYSTRSIIPAWVV